MDPKIHRHVQHVHDSPTMAVLALAGGGVQAVSWLAGVPGASRTLLEIRLPYAPEAMADFLGYEPRQVASPETAKAMARAAYERASRLRPSGAPIVGVGCTAAIATDRSRRGEHRCFVSAWTDHDVTAYAATLRKGLRDRAGEDEIVSRLVLRALAEASEVEGELPMGLSDGEPLGTARTPHADPIERLLAGEVGTVTCSPDGNFAVDQPLAGAVLPGSFDPLHRGHEALAVAASTILGEGVTFEMSVSNVDKPDLDQDEVRKRVAQFAGKWPVVASRTPTFFEKAKLFPGTTFVIGWDTAFRLVEPRYYGGRGSGILEALAGIQRLGCRFLVAGRLAEGVFRTLDDVDVPRGFEDMFTAIPEAAFRSDVSSTQLRAAGRGS